MVQELFLVWGHLLQSCSVVVCLSSSERVSGEPWAGVQGGGGIAGSCFGDLNKNQFSNLMQCGAFRSMTRVVRPMNDRQGCKQRSQGCQEKILLVHPSVRKCCLCDPHADEQQRIAMPPPVLCKHRLVKARVCVEPLFSGFFGTAAFVVPNVRLGVHDVVIQGKRGSSMTVCCLFILFITTFCHTCLSASSSSCRILWLIALCHRIGSPNPFLKLS